MNQVLAHALVPQTRLLIGEASSLFFMIGLLILIRYLALRMRSQAALRVTAAMLCLLLATLASGVSATLQNELLSRLGGTLDAYFIAGAISGLAGMSGIPLVRLLDRFHGFKLVITGFALLACSITLALFALVSVLSFS